MTITLLSYYVLHTTLHTIRSTLKSRLQ